MMKIHKEGSAIVVLTAVILAIVVVGVVASGWLRGGWQVGAMVLASVGGWLAVAQFFRNPPRRVPQPHADWVYAPADGKVVVIEEVEESEYLQRRCLQVSIFMSLTSVHANRVPVSGRVVYSQHHAGSYLVAWHPKSSTENERTTVVVRTERHEILLRQIAGAVARRIVNYLHAGDAVEQGSEWGFIKFGSRVDVLLPTDAVVRVKIGDAVRGNLDVLAILP